MNWRRRLEGIVSRENYIAGAKVRIADRFKNDGSTRIRVGIRRKFGILGRYYNLRDNSTNISCTFNGRKQYEWYNDYELVYLENQEVDQLDTTMKSVRVELDKLEKLMNGT